MKKLLSLFFLVVMPISAQVKDCFGGVITYVSGQTAAVGSGPANQQAATCSRSATTTTCTVTNGAVYKIGEPMQITGTGTALDYSDSDCQANRARSQPSGYKITNIVGNTVTMTGANSGTVGSVSGTIRPGRWYRQVITTPFGTGPMLMTPADHWLFNQQVVQASNAISGKYAGAGTNCAVADFERTDWFAVGYNGTGQADLRDDFYDAGTCPSIARMPFMFEQFITSYFSNNLATGSFTGLDQAGKNMNWALASSYSCGGAKRAAMDYADARWPSFVSGYMGANNFLTMAQSMWMVGVVTQDTGVGGAAPTNATWEFQTSPTGFNDCHQGFLVAATSPHQTVNKNVVYSGSNAPYLYPDPKVYMKTAAASNLYGSSSTPALPANCDPTNAGKLCSMRDFLCGTIGLYANVTALNAAWGTSYTTCDSSETVFTAVSLGTGNGATTVFTTTLNTNVTPTSFQLLVGGTVKAGDCPQFLASCGGSVGQGVITSHDTTVSSGTVTYSTGAVTVTFTSAPANGVALTMNYTTGGWQAGGTGLMDEDGTHLGTIGVCPFLPTAFANNHPYIVGDIFSVGTTSWQYTSTAGTSQSAGTPAFSATTGVTTPSGTMVATSIGPPVCGTGGTFTGTFSNAQMGADLNTFSGYVAAWFFSGARSSLKALAPDLPYWGADQIGVWQTPSNSNVINAANSYVDVAMTGLWDGSKDAAGPIKFDYFTHYGPNLPMSNYLTPCLTAEDKYGCGFNFPQFATAQAKGQWWYTVTNYMLSQIGHDGQTHFTASQWVSNIDGLQSNSFGFKDDLYNLINGVENVSATGVTCTFVGLTTCGGEAVASYNGKDMLTHAGCGNCIMDANALWLQGAAVAPAPIAPIPSIFSKRELKYLLKPTLEDPKDSWLRPTPAQ